MGGRGRGFPRRALRQRGSRFPRGFSNRIGGRGVNRAPLHQSSSMHSPTPSQILSGLDPVMQLQLTKAIVETVFKGNESTGKTSFGDQMSSFNEPNYLHENISYYPQGDALHDHKSSMSSSTRYAGDAEKNFRDRNQRPCMDEMNPHFFNSRGASRKRERYEDNMEYPECSFSSKKKSIRKNFIKLICPHCPDQQLVTFQAYRFHLETNKHQNNVKGFARQHSEILWNLRTRQRSEQNSKETAWANDNLPDFKTSILKFCAVCKLKYRCSAERFDEGVHDHEHSDLHQKQMVMVDSDCSLCGLKFHNRLLYEHHLASIIHRTELSKKQSQPVQDQKESDDEMEFDMSNFVTMDSVGEYGLESEDETTATEAVDDVETSTPLLNDDPEEPHSQEDDIKEQSLELAADLDASYDHVDTQSLSDNVPDWEDTYENEGLVKIEGMYCTVCKLIIRTDNGTDAVSLHIELASHKVNLEQSRTK